MRLPRRLFNRLLAFACIGASSSCGSREEPAAATGTATGTSGGAPASSPRPGAVRFLALGDSYTIGEGVAPAGRWPAQLAARLRESGVDVADPQIIARTGWRTDDLDAAITAANPQGPFALVTLLIGVNNQYQGRSVDEYRGELPALLGRAIQLAGGKPSRVIVLSIPDWGATRYARDTDRARIAHEIDAFNAVNRDAARRAGTRYVDVTPSSRLAFKDPTLLAADGLHPSGKLYARWVDLLLPEAKSALVSKPG